MYKTQSTYITDKLKKLIRRINSFFVSKWCEVIEEARSLENYISKWEYFTEKQADTWSF